MAQQTFTCAACSAAFVNQEQLEAHRAQVHADERYVCPTCLEVFETDNLLALHQQEVHSDVGADAVPCPECGLSFRSASILEEHIARRHPHFPGMTRDS